MRSTSMLFLLMALVVSEARLHSQPTEKVFLHALRRNPRGGSHGGEGGDHGGHGDPQEGDYVEAHFNTADGEMSESEDGARVISSDDGEVTVEFDDGVQQTIPEEYIVHEYEENQEEYDEYDAYQDDGCKEGEVVCFEPPPPDCVGEHCIEDGQFCASEEEGCPPQMVHCNDDEIKCIWEAQGEHFEHEFCVPKEWETCPPPPVECQEGQQECWTPPLDGCSGYACEGQVFCVSEDDHCPEARKPVPPTPECSNGEDLCSIMPCPDPFQTEPEMMVPEEWCDDKGHCPDQPLCCGPEEHECMNPPDHDCEGDACKPHYFCVHNEAEPWCPEPKPGCNETQDVLCEVYNKKGEVQHFCADKDCGCPPPPVFCSEEQRTCTNPASEESCYGLEEYCYDGATCPPEPDHCADDEQLCTQLPSDPEGHKTEWCQKKNDENGEPVHCPPIDAAQTIEHEEAIICGEGQVACSGEGDASAGVPHQYCMPAEPGCPDAQSLVSDTPVTLIHGARHHLRHRHHLQARHHLRQRKHSGHGHHQQEVRHVPQSSNAAPPSWVHKARRHAVQDVPKSSHMAFTSRVRNARRQAVLMRERRKLRKARHIAGSKKGEEGFQALMRERRRLRKAAE